MSSSRATSGVEDDRSVALENVAVETLQICIDMGLLHVSMDDCRKALQSPLVNLSSTRAVQWLMEDRQTASSPAPSAISHAHEAEPERPIESATVTSTTTRAVKRDSQSSPVAQVRGNRIHGRRRLRRPPLQQGTSASENTVSRNKVAAATAAEFATAVPPTATASGATTASAGAAASTRTHTRTPCTTMPCAPTRGGGASAAPKVTAKFLPRNRMLITAVLPFVLNRAEISEVEIRPQRRLHILHSSGRVVHFRLPRPTDDEDFEITGMKFSKAKRRLQITVQLAARETSHRSALVDCNSESSVSSGQSTLSPWVHKEGAPAPIKVKRETPTTFPTETENRDPEMQPIPASRLKHDTQHDAQQQQENAVASGDGKDTLDAQETRKTSHTPEAHASHEEEEEEEDEEARESPAATQIKREALAEATTSSAAKSTSEGLDVDDMTIFDDIPDDVLEDAINGNERAWAQEYVPLTSAQGMPAVSRTPLCVPSAAATATAAEEDEHKENERPMWEASDYDTTANTTMSTTTGGSSAMKPSQAQTPCVGTNANLAPQTANQTVNTRDANRIMRDIIFAPTFSTPAEASAEPSEMGSATSKGRTGDCAKDTNNTVSLQTLGCLAQDEWDNVRDSNTAASEDDEHVEDMTHESEDTATLVTLGGLAQEAWNGVNAAECTVSVPPPAPPLSQFGEQAPVTRASEDRCLDVVLPGKWKRGEEIGRGGFGRVYKGFAYGESPMFIAIKELEAKGQDSAKDVAEFANEIDVMRRLRHPNIVRYMGSERASENTLLIFQEWVEGGSLKKFISDYGQPGLDDGEVARITRQLLSGLAYLHEQHVVHRDIKPGNVLVDKSLCIKLADFGSSVQSSDEDLAHAGAHGLCGTPAYMAPEVVLAASDKTREYGQEADIWSVGATVYKMSTGMTLWQAEVEACSSRSSRAGGLLAFVVEAVSRGQRPRLRLEGKSKSFRDFVQRFFCWDQQQRPSAAELLHDPFIPRDSGSVPLALDVLPKQLEEDDSESVDNLQSSSEPPVVYGAQRARRKGRRHSM